MTERYYVYAITGAPFQLPEGLSGFGGGRLFVLPYADLGAVVSLTRDAGGEEVAPTPSSENLLLHERVVEAIHAAGNALPVRFGATLPDADAVKSALAQRYAVLQADVDQIGDKVEVGISALWRTLNRDADASGDSQAAEDHRLDSDGDDSTERRPGLAYLRARQREYRQAESARRRALALAQQLDAELGPHAIQRVRSICPTARLALRESYLLRRDQVSAFKAAFEVAQHDHKEVWFLLSGPWPPYSFVTPPTQPNSDPESAQCTRRDRTEAG